MNNIYELIINYIENNKKKYNIDYEETIKAIKEVIETIENEYKGVENYE